MIAAREDLGLAAAIDAAGGVRPLAARLQLTRRAVQKWDRVPQDRVFPVSRATGLAPERLRPDLAEWIAAERARQRLAAARERFSLVRAAAPALAATPRQALDQVLVDYLTAFAAVRFVAGERELGLAPIICGRKRELMGARSWAMGLAHVGAGASSTTVGLFFGTSRQNIDNASERYLRARDGDDPDDFVAGNDGRDRVLERGRLRPAKAAAVDLWDAEQRFLALLEGQVIEERKRA